MKKIIKVKKVEEVKPTSDGGEALRNFKPIELGGEEDKQYAEAVKILKDIDRYQIN
jgi:carboxyl-terminal processing protease